MTTAYTWTISSLDVAPSEDGLIDVIKTAHWRYYATDDTDGVTAETYGAHGFASPEPASYTPFESVVQEDIVGWIEGLIGEEGVEAMNTSLNNQLENIRNPPIVSKQPPWAAPLVEEPVGLTYHPYHTETYYA